MTYATILRHAWTTMMCVTGTVVLAAQQPRDVAAPIVTGTSEISGTVLMDDASGAPVRRAVVTLTGDAPVVRLTASTDEAGRFAFTALPPGRYSLAASKGAYLSTNYGSKRPGGPGIAVAVGSGQRVAGLGMKMMKGSVLAGTVVDEDGSPAPNVPVSVSRSGFSYWTGGQRLDVVATQLTDARGMYRIYGLPSGDYSVFASFSIGLVGNPAAGLSSFGDPRAVVDVAQVAEGDVQRALQMLREAGGPGLIAATSTVNYARVYYPGTTAVDDAVKIALGSAEERVGIDIRLRLVPTARIVGVIVGPTGLPFPNASVNVMDPSPTEANVSNLVLRSARADAEGRFTLPSMEPGRYTVFASADSLFGKAEVTVDGRDATTSISLGAPPTLSGQLRFEGTSPAPADLRAWLPLLSAESAVDPRFFFARPSAVGEAGVFQYELAPGRYRTDGVGGRPWRYILSATWYLKSFVLNGVDIADVPFEVKPEDRLENAVVTFTDRHTGISGTMRDAAGNPATNFMLIVFSADKRLWLPLSRRTRMVRPGADGRFTLPNLAPGDYFISAVNDAEEGAWYDARFLEALASQAPIKLTLAEGDQKVQDITVR